MKAGAFVIDASVIVEFLLPGKVAESATDFILSALPQQRLLIPWIAVTEVAAAITRGLRRRALTLGDTRAAYESWRQMLADDVFEVYQGDELIDAAFDLSISLHHALHDCVYIALAQQRDASLVTYDTALARKARSLGIGVETITV